MIVKCPNCKFEYEVESNGKYLCGVCEKKFFFFKDGTTELATAPDADLPAAGGAISSRQFHTGDMILGHYRVIKMIATGTSDVIYRCFDENSCEHVMLKDLFPDIAIADESTARFQKVTELPATAPAAPAPAPVVPAAPVAPVAPAVHIPPSAPIPAAIPAAAPAPIPVAAPAAVPAAQPVMSAAPVVPVAAPAAQPVMSAAPAVPVAAPAAQPVMPAAPVVPVAAPAAQPVMPAAPVVPVAAPVVVPLDKNN